MFLKFWQIIQEEQKIEKQNKLKERMQAAILKWVDQEVKKFKHHEGEKKVNDKFKTLEKY